MQLRKNYFQYFIVFLIPIFLGLFNFVLSAFLMPSTFIDWGFIKMIFLLYFIIRMLVLWAIPLTYKLLFPTNTKKNKMMGLLFILVVTNLLVFFAFENEFPISIRTRGLEMQLMLLSYNATALILYYLYEFTKFGRGLPKNSTQLN